MYIRRTEKPLETKSYRRILIKGINTWAVSLIRYPFLKWAREELKQMDQRIRKLMTKHKVFHPRDDTGRLYESRKEGRRALASIQDSVDTSINQLEDNIHRRGGKLIVAI